MLKKMPGTYYVGQWSIFRGGPVGTIAAMDPNDKHPVNYDQVFVRDFIPSALAFLLNGETKIVNNFLLQTLKLQQDRKIQEDFSLGLWAMPASFKVTTRQEDGIQKEQLIADFGESAIGRVKPYDSAFWWILLLRAYGKLSGDFTLQENEKVQRGVKLIIQTCLENSFPCLMVEDGSCMIDRRMGIYGFPLEIEVLFYSALLCCGELLPHGDAVLDHINYHLKSLSYHMRHKCWIDIKKLNHIYRKTDYLGEIPFWVADWIGEEGGYFVGNSHPGVIDFRFFTLGNLWAIISALGSKKQNHDTFNLIEDKWHDLAAKMPMKICYPALERKEWKIITGADPKNTPWSYHNGGSWPTLLWHFTLACMKMGRTDLAEKAVNLAGQRLFVDRWPEYYDSPKGSLIGKEARLMQTWTAASFLTSRMLLKNPEKACLLFWEDRNKNDAWCGHVAW